MSELVKRTKEIANSLSYDCWCVTLYFLSEYEDFKSLVLSIPGLYSYIKTIHQRSLMNIMFKLRKTPPNSSKYPHVHNVALERVGRKMFVEDFGVVRELHTYFPNLTSLEYVFRFYIESRRNFREKISREKYYRTKLPNFIFNGKDFRNLKKLSVFIPGKIYLGYWFSRCVETKEQLLCRSIEIADFPVLACLRVESCPIDEGWLDDIGAGNLYDQIYGPHIRERFANNIAQTNLKLKKLSQLRTLSTFGVWLDEESEKFLTSLRELTVSETFLQDTIKKSPKNSVETLNICRYTDIRSLKCFPELRTLNFILSEEFQEMHYYSLVKVKEISSMDHLREIRIENNHERHRKKHDLVLKTLNVLEYLHVEFIRVKVVQCPNIKVIEFYNSSLKTDSLYFDKLETLVFYNSTVYSQEKEYETVRLNTFISKFSNLQILEVVHKPMGTSLTRKTPAKILLKSFPSLRTLDLEWIGLGVVMDGSKMASKLERINLKYLSNFLIPKNKTMNPLQSFSYHFNSNRAAKRFGFGCVSNWSNLASLSLYLTEEFKGTVNQTVKVKGLNHLRILKIRSLNSKVIYSWKAAKVKNLQALEHLILDSIEILKLDLSKSSKLEQLVISRVKSIAGTRKKKKKEAVVKAAPISLVLRQNGFLRQISLDETLLRTGFDTEKVNYLELQDSVILQSEENEVIVIDDSSSEEENENYDIDSYFGRLEHLSVVLLNNQILRRGVQDICLIRNLKSLHIHNITNEEMNINNLKNLEFLYVETRKFSEIVITYCIKDQYYERNENSVRNVLNRIEFLRGGEEPNSEIDNFEMVYFGKGEGSYISEMDIPSAGSRKKVMKLEQYQFYLEDLPGLKEIVHDSHQTSTLVVLGPEERIEVKHHRSYVKK